MGSNVLHAKVIPTLLAVAKAVAIRTQELAVSYTYSVCTGRYYIYIMKHQESKSLHLCRCPFHYKSALIVNNGVLWFSAKCFIAIMIDCKTSALKHFMVSYVNAIAPCKCQYFCYFCQSS